LSATPHRRPSHAADVVHRRRPRIILPTAEPPTPPPLTRMCTSRTQGIDAPPVPAAHASCEIDRRPLSRCPPRPNASPRRADEFDPLSREPRLFFVHFSFFCVQDQSTTTTLKAPCFMAERRSRDPPNGGAGRVTLHYGNEESIFSFFFFLKGPHDGLAGILQGHLMRKRTEEKKREHPRKAPPPAPPPKAFFSDARTLSPTAQACE